MGPGVPIPPATQRTPDLVLPLDQRGRDVVLAYAGGNQPPMGSWKLSSDDELAKQAAALDEGTIAELGPILAELASSAPSDADLGPDGRVGMHFDSDGADLHAVDARFQGQDDGNTRVGRVGDFYFVFYKRYPGPNGDTECDGMSYCRLIVLKKSDA